MLLRIDRRYRRCIRIDLLAVAASSGAEAINHPDWIERSGNLSGLTVSSHGPHELLIPEFFRHHHLEHILVPPHHKMSRLATIHSRLEAVIRSNCNVEFFLVVPVHVSEPHVERTIRISVVTFVNRRDALSEPMSNLNELRACRFGNQ